MHVIIENTVALNTGDAAILVAIIEIVRQTFGPQTRISVFDSAPEVASRLYPEIRFHALTTSHLSGQARWFGRTRKLPWQRLLAALQRHAFRRALRARQAGQALQPSRWLHPGAIANIECYRNADVVISTGGTYLVEHYKLRNRFEELLKDLALGKPLILFTQSLGPFHQPDNQVQMKRIANGAALVLLRDTRSKAHLRDIGVVHDRLAVVADSVFALARPDWLAAPAAQPSPRLRVAVSVRRWTHFEGRDRSTGTRHYEAAVAHAISRLVLERQAEVVFLSTCQGVPEYLYDDSEVAQRIVESLEGAVRQHVRIDRDFHSPTALMALLRQFDCAISTRMHMAILGLCVGLPVMPIAYEFKTTELYASLGQAHWVTDISNIEADTFSALALRFAEQRAEFRAAVAPRVLELAQSARSAGPMMATALAAVTSTDASGRPPSRP